MLSTATDSKVSGRDVYNFSVELNQHEKMLLIVALRNAIDERLKMAEFMNGSDAATAYFNDAGRLSLIAQKLGNTTSAWRYLSFWPVLLWPAFLSSILFSFSKMFTLNDRRERELFEHYEQLAEFFEFDENAHNPIMADCDLFEEFDYA